jgi:hypothetical protein
MLLAKFIRDVKNEELSKDFFMWEKDSNRPLCRGCQGVFSSFKRRHHCRLCGGLFCESCTMSNVDVKGESIDRVCRGCLNCEAPGNRIRAAVEARIQNNLAGLSDIVFNLEQIKLEYGSSFEPANSTSAKIVVPSNKGYFELVNKSTAFCAVKVLTGENMSDFNSFWEVSRPSFCSLPPGHLLNAYFGEAVVVEVCILYGNPNIIPGDAAVIPYKTDSSQGVIAPCAAIENYWLFSLYRIQCDQKNILLKFKGDGILEPRAGTSLERNGIFGKLTGSSKSNTLDFSTNVTASMMTRIA